MTKSVKRLYASFQPNNYQLFIAPDRKELTFHGTVTIVGKKIGRPSKRLTFHQNGLTITNASVTRHDKKGDEAIEISRINNQNSLHEVRLHANQLLYGGRYTVSLEFSGTITKGMTGLYPCYFKHEGIDHTLLATQFESHHAREVFPCIDEPEAKASFDLTIEHEPGVTVLANTPALSTKPTKTVFETTPIMSSYLLAFVIGELHSKETKTNRGTDVRVWGTIAQPKNSFDFALDVAKRSIEYFEDYFKTPYPLTKADHVALPDFSSGAMENWGLITYREIALLLYPNAVSQSMKELIATVVAHETSHQWFGNLVTMKWWDDLWLNESFANMMEYAAVDHMFPEWKIWESFVTVEGIGALRRDATPGVQAVKTAVHHPDEISTLFDPSIVYAKGGRLLYMLKNYIGDDAFRNGLQAYFKDHAYKNTVGADLWAALSKSSGKDIAAFMNPWLERSGFPVVSVTQKQSNLIVSQEHFLDTPAKADSDRLWPVPLFSSDNIIPDLLVKPSVTMQTNSTAPVLVNTESRGHYIVRYTESTHKEALVQLIKDHKLGEIDRLMLLVDATMLARAGYESIANALAMLPAYKDETNDAVWESIALLLADTRRFYDYDESLESKVQAVIRELIVKEYARLGWDERPSDTASDQRQRATIIGFGVYSEAPDILSRALSLFESYKSDNTVVSAELRGIVFSAAVKHAAPGAVEYLLDLYGQTTSSDLQRDITGGVTSTKDNAVAILLLSRITDATIIKPQDADRWLVSLLRNRYTRETAWQWMEDNWQWIIDTYKNDKSYDNFPRYGAIVCNTPEWEQTYRTFFEPKMNETALKRNIQIGLEEIAARITWLKRDLPAVQNYFNTSKAQ